MKIRVSVIHDADSEKYRPSVNMDPCSYSLTSPFLMELSSSSGMSCDRPLAWGRFPPQKRPLSSIALTAPPGFHLNILSEQMRHVFKKKKSFKLGLCLQNGSNILEFKPHPTLCSLGGKPCTQPKSQLPLLGKRSRHSSLLPGASKGLVKMAWQSLVLSRSLAWNKCPMCGSCCCRSSTDSPCWWHSMLLCGCHCYYKLFHKNGCNIGPSITVWHSEEMCHPQHASVFWCLLIFMVFEM